MLDANKLTELIDIGFKTNMKSHLNLYTLGPIFSHQFISVKMAKTVQVKDGSFSYSNIKLQNFTNFV